MSALQFQLSLIIHLANTLSPINVYSDDPFAIAWNIFATSASMQMYSTIEGFIERNAAIPLATFCREIVASFNIRTSRNRELYYQSTSNEGHISFLDSFQEFYLSAIHGRTLQRGPRGSWDAFDREQGVFKAAFKKLYSSDQRFRLIQVTSFNPYHAEKLCYNAESF